ncbi:hypothetical protein FRC03_009545 [Tulasnella sp. 419]|nr:hypothetical protein FRC02_009210 [Tulasnella sp. 418]KAG8958007.1 hypothetical protein FRC03_009545 [Tulasnella sp. 419]
MSLNQDELSILEKVIHLRNRLTVLKQTYDIVKTQDVMSIYHAMVKQVSLMMEVRDEENLFQPSNRLDKTMSDVFSLLSLFFLRIGKTRECPATYCQIATIRNLLDHMNESSSFTETDLKPFRARLDELREIVTSDRQSGKHPEAMTKLLEKKLNAAESVLARLQESLSFLSVELVPIHQKLVALRRQLVALAAKPKPSKTDLKPLQEELRKIDSKRVDGKFLGPGGVVPASQALVSGILEECFEIAQEIQAREHEVSFTLKPIYDRLMEIRHQLESLVMTHRWTLRETDLWNYETALREIDKMRVDGKFVDSEGNKPEGQYVLLYLLRRCYGLIYRLLSSSEPVSEELMPIANKLSTVKKCLNEVLKYGGPFSPRDLYPYQLALFQIDQMRRDGKFVSSQDGSIPEGQGIIMAHLNECHELLEMLKESMSDSDNDEL